VHSEPGKWNESIQAAMKVDVEKYRNETIKQFKEQNGGKRSEEQ
jgi:hypothetical protein